MGMQLARVIMGPAANKANVSPSDGLFYLATDTGALSVGSSTTKTWNELASTTTESVTAAQISDASAVGRAVLTAADQAAARAAIGAGTSSLALGTSASTAMAGNASASTIQAPAFQSDGGALNFAGGTILEALQAIADLADPGGA